jgi:hypothetical protein
MNKSIGAAVASVALAAAVAAATPARALSADIVTHMDDWTFFATIDLALKSEIYRNLLIGETAKAACIHENFIAVDNNKDGIYNIIDDLVVTRVIQNPKSAEYYILKDLNERCAMADSGKNATTPPVDTKFTPINRFFETNPDRLSESRMISVALGMQALRANSVGNRDYTQCILTNLVIPKDATTPADGFTDLFHQLDSHRTATTPLEQILAAVIIKYCGKEPVPPGLRPEGTPPAGPADTPN